MLARTCTRHAHAHADAHTSLLPMRIINHLIYIVRQPLKTIESHEYGGSLPIRRSTACRLPLPAPCHSPPCLDSAAREDSILSNFRSTAHSSHEPWGHHVLMQHASARPPNSSACARCVHAPTCTSQVRRRRRKDILLRNRPSPGAAAWARACAGDLSSGTARLRRDTHTVASTRGDFREASIPKLAKILTHLVLRK